MCPGAVTAISLASTNTGLYLVQGGAAAKTYGMDQSNNTFADRLLSNDTDELGSAPEQSETAPMRLAEASGQAASAPGQNRSRAPSSSNSPVKTSHSSSASQSVLLRDSIAGLLQSEQSASHHSAASGSSIAFEVAQFSGFGTGSEQITSPGLIRSVRTDAMGDIMQSQPVSIAQDWGPSQQSVSQPRLGLKDSPVKQAGHRQSIDGDLNSLGVGVNAMELQSRGGDAVAATGDSKELSVRCEARLEGYPPAGTSSGMQLGQLQMSSELKRGGNLLSEAAPQVASDSPASSSRFKQVML